MLIFYFIYLFFPFEEISALYFDVVHTCGWFAFVTSQVLCKTSVLELNDREMAGCRVDCHGWLSGDLR